MSLRLVEVTRGEFLYGCKNCSFKHPKSPVRKQDLGPPPTHDCPAARCEKYPSLLRKFCSHCQGTAQGTDENPRFSIREDIDENSGYPVVEILKNGGQIHRFDSHFRFGRRKAEMLLACLPALKEFGWSSPEQRLRFQTRVLEVPEFCIRVKVFVEMHPDFERSTGEEVDQPWLRLQAMPPNQEHLGLGVIKCRAVWSVQDELRAWVSSQV